ISRCSTRGPSEAAGGRRIARSVAGRDAGQFGVRAGCPVDKPRSPSANLAGRMPARRVSGVAFLFGYLSLWPRKEKVTRLPKADESPCFEISKVKTGGDQREQVHV